MNNTMRNLTLSAAALAALMAVAPKASADDRGRGRFSSPHQEFRGQERREGKREDRRDDRRESAWRAPGRGFVAPARSFARRLFTPVRFFSYCPGPGYAYIANYGWVVPPFFGAVWVPDHYDIGGFFVEGGWR
jgi:hypothetical protein